MMLRSKPTTSINDQESLQRIVNEEEGHDHEETKAPSSRKKKCCLDAPPCTGFFYLMTALHVGVLELLLLLEVLIFLTHLLVKHPPSRPFIIQLRACCVDPVVPLLDFF
ncbi:hypothetical protein Pelo_12612 [Pelomyxa schiedti]|nr:hypothetical protein Pelo_12612 [Pelomyxa schiedti]